MSFEAGARISHNFVSPVNRETNVLDKAPVLYREEKGIARIILNRPEALNAMNEELLRQAASLLEKARADDAVKAVIAEKLRGVGIAATDAKPYPEYASDYTATYFTDPDGIRLEITNYRQERRERHDNWQQRG